MNEVPIIDLAGPPADVARQIDAAASDVGFFQIVGHGIDLELVDAALGAMDRFFALPAEVKAATVPPSPDINRGFAPSQSEALGYSAGLETPPDLLEAFIVGPEHPDLDDPAVASQRDGVFAPNRWPVDADGPIDEVRAPLVAYFDAVGALARRLTELFARALDLPVDFFADKVDHSTETMRLNHYDRGLDDPDPLPDQGWLGAHTDYGIVTVLHADPVPGLELLTLDGRWEGVIAEPGAFIVNLGDLLAEWTNDRWRSTVHRVVPPPVGGVARRRSIAFFLDGNHDALVECLPTCVSADDPPRYPPILAGDHLAAKVLAGRSRDTSARDALVDPIGERLR